LLIVDVIDSSYFYFKLSLVLAEKSLSIYIKYMQDEHLQD